MTLSPSQTIKGGRGGSVCKEEETDAIMKQLDQGHPGKEKEKKPKHTNKKKPPPKQTKPPKNPTELGQKPALPCQVKVMNLSSYS